MDTEETRALWDQGVEAWNAWAVEAIQRKEALEAAGTWQADWFGEGQNEETQGWLAETKADFSGVEFATDADFENFTFPGLAAFEGAHFLGRANFTGATFHHLARFTGTHFDGDGVFRECKFLHLTEFEEAAFASAAEFEKAEFLRESTGPLVPAVRFPKAQFGKRADFRGVKFTGHAEFSRTQFSGTARYDEAEFAADANFEGAVFEGTAGMLKTRFLDKAKFDLVQFRGDARFPEAEFQKAALFEGAVFAAKSLFRLARFGDEATFQNVLFDDEARFSDAQFVASVSFADVRFSSNADFENMTIGGDADFCKVHFGGDAKFDKATFAQDASFLRAAFNDSTSFISATFKKNVNFQQSTFKSHATFRETVFEDAAEFSAIQAHAAFVLAGCRFQEVPSFHVSSFREAPRFDHMTVTDPLRFRPELVDKNGGDPRPRLLRAMKVCGNADYAMRYRRLRQLAAGTHDDDRIQWFFAQELRCRRFWHDKPLGKGRAKFWLGWAYGGISDFGRSLFRPAALWVASIFFFTLVYLGLRRAAYFASAPGPVASNVPLFPTWPDAPSFWSVVQYFGDAIWWLLASIINLFSGGGCISGDGGATAEAFFLSLKNSLFFLGWESPDSARRVYSCLYGYDGATGSGLLRVPLSVSTVAIIQNVIGVFLIALFVMGLRNLLRSR